MESNQIAVSMTEAARLLGVSRPTVYQYANMVDFPAFRVGGRVLVSVDGLRQWVNDRAGVSADVQA